jgi:hypothetical protein
MYISKLLVISTQILLIVLYSVFLENCFEKDKYYPTINTQISELKQEILDVRVLCLLGFGLQLSLYKNNLFSSIIYPIICYVLSLQFFTVFNGLFFKILNGSGDKICFNLYRLLDSEYACLALLSSLYGVYGKISHYQLYLYSILFLLFYSLNANILGLYKIVDNSYLLQIWLFASVYGYVFNYMINKKHSLNKENNKLKYKEITSITTYLNLIGTIIIYAYFPFVNNSNTCDERIQANNLINGYIVSTVNIIFIMFLKSDINLYLIQTSLFTSNIFIAASSSFSQQPIGALVLGIVASMVTYLYNLLSKYTKYDNGINLNIAIIVNAFFGSLLNLVIVSLTSLDKLMYTIEHDNKTLYIRYYTSGIFTTIGIAFISAIISFKFVDKLEKLMFYYNDDIKLDDFKKKLLNKNLPNNVVDNVVDNIRLNRYNRHLNNFEEVEDPDILEANIETNIINNRILSPRRLFISGNNYSNNSNVNTNRNVNTNSNV